MVPGSVGGPPTMPPSTNRWLQRGDLARALRRDGVRVDVDPGEARAGPRDIDGSVRRADGEDDLRLGDERVEGAGVAEAGSAHTSGVAPSLGRPDHLTVHGGADNRTHLTRMEQPDDHRTSASTKTKNATEMTPFMVKNAASSRRRSPGRTSECS